MFIYFHELGNCEPWCGTDGDSGELTAGECYEDGDCGNGECCNSYRIHGPPMQDASQEKGNCESCYDSNILTPCEALGDGTGC